MWAGFHKNPRVNRGLRHKNALRTLTTGFQNDSYFQALRIKFYNKSF
jgi:hypothetical protein